MSSPLAPVWFNFFLEAGIPPSDAGNYAVTFTQNRIQPDMMSDLTKEYLAEMGITVLGDVIAILKHARVVHTQAAREKALQYTGLARQLPELPEADGSSADKKAANKSLQKALTKQTSSPVSIQKAVTKPTAPVSVTAPISLSKSITEKTGIGLENSIPSASKAKNQPAKLAAGVKILSAKKPVLPSRTENPANGAVTQLRTSVNKKAQENRSSVNVSSSRVGTALSPLEDLSLIRTEVSGGKSSVFNRLGREVNSADTAVTKTTADKTVFKVTLQGMDDDGLVPPPKSIQTKNSSIFDRLGNKTSVDALDSTPPTLAVRKSQTVVATTKRPLVKTTTTTTTKSLKERLGPLATAAAAAATASTSAAATRKPVGVVGQQADQSTGAASAKLRLGIKRPSSTGVAAESPSEPKQARKDIKTRLGLPTGNNVVSTSASRPVAVAKPQVQEPSARPKTAGVFGRLGSIK